LANDLPSALAVEIKSGTFTYFTGRIGPKIQEASKLSLPSNVVNLQLPRVEYTVSAEPIGAPPTLVRLPPLARSSQYYSVEFKLGVAKQPPDVPNSQPQPNVKHD
jgi:hypothetical protein